MQDLIEKVFTDPTFVWVGLILVVLITLAVFKKLYKLVMILGTVFVLYMGFLYFVDKDLEKTVEDFQEKAEDAIEKAEDAIEKAEDIINEAKK